MTSFAPMNNSDAVSLYALSLAPDIGPDCWDRARPQPVLLTVHAHLSLALAGSADDVAHSLHYGRLAHALSALATPPRTFPSLRHLADAAADVVLAAQHPPVDGVHVLAEAPKLLLAAHSLSVELVRSQPASSRLAVHINQLALHAIIGVNPPERLHKQLVVTTVSFHDPVSSDFPHRPIVDQLAQHIQATQYLTLEAFATSVARLACFIDGMDRVTIKAQKPSAVSFGHSSAVQLTRDRAFFQSDASS